MQFGGCEFGSEPLPDHDGQIFGGRGSGEELGNFLVQEAMVEGIEHFPAHDVFQLLEIDDETGARIDSAFHCNFESVVVAVSVRIIALAEDALLLFRSEIRIVIVVRSGEFGFASQVDHRRQVPVLSSQFSAFDACYWTRVLPRASRLGYFRFRHRSYGPSTTPGRWRGPSLSVAASRQRWVVRKPWQSGYSRLRNSRGEFF